MNNSNYICKSNLKKNMIKLYESSTGLGIPRVTCRNDVTGSLTKNIYIDIVYVYR